MAECQTPAGHLGPGGFDPPEPPSAHTLAITYANGVAAADQTLTLLDADGGGVIIDGSNAGFTGANALTITGAAGASVVFPRVGGITLVGGVLLLPDGVVGAPSLAFTTDVVCGLYHTGAGAAGSLLVSVNSVNKVAITATGMGVGNVIAPVSPLVVDVNSNSTLLANATSVVIGNSNTTVGNVSTLMLTQTPTAANLGAGLVATHTNRTGGARATNLAFWILSGNLGSEVARCTENSNFIIGTTADATASRLRVVASKSVAAAAGAAWDGISFAASTLTLTGVVTPITTLNFFNIAAPVITAASAVAVTDFYTTRIGAATFVGAGPASATRSWSLGIDGNTKFGGGITVAAKQILVGASPYTVLATDFMLEVQSNGGAITINLPALTGGTVPNGRLIPIQDSGYNAAVNNITFVRGNVADKINNVAASFIQNISGAVIWLKANTTNNNWEIV